MGQAERLDPGPREDERIQDGAQTQCRLIRIKTKCAYIWMGNDRQHGRPRRPDTCLPAHPGHVMTSLLVVDSLIVRA
jgi:hypothetical protein